jgi:hypothetical protein
LHGTEHNTSFEIASAQFARGFMLANERKLINLSFEA